MRLKTFRAFTLNEALEAAKADLGDEAAILHTRTFKRGGFLGIGGREIVEIIASEAVESTEETTDVGGEASSGIDPIARAEARNQQARVDSPQVTTAATRAYAASAAPATAGDADADEGSSVGGLRPEDAPASGSLEVDREKTRTLARALAIRLERQQAARSSAGVSGPDDVIETPASSSAPDPSPVPRATAAVDSPVVASPLPSPSPSPVPSPVPSPLPSPLPSPPPRDPGEHFVIGAGGVLIPERQATSPAPRVIELTPPTESVSPRAADRVVVPVIETFETGETIADPAPASPPSSETQPERVEDAEAAVNASSAVTPASPALPGPNATDSNSTEPTSTESKPEPEADELDAIRSTVGRLLAVGGVPSPDAEDPASLASGRSDALADAYASLIAQELSRDLAERVVSALQEELDEASLEDPEAVRAALLGHLATLVPTAEDLEFTRPRDGRPRTIAFVGPTGVGKTTTLAKIAATMTLRDEIKVGLVTSDTYRIAAVDQLRTYAEILGLRLEIASTPVEMRAALERCADLDAVLIDTPGRSQNDTDRIADLRALVDAARPHETHLVLSGTAAERVLLREAEAFSTLGPDRVVLTKLDEAVTFGMLVSVVRRIGRRISWVTTGQEVPTDVERATSHRLANLMLGESVKS